MSSSNTSAAPTSTGPTQEQSRLKTFFDGQDVVTHPSRWDELWKAGDFIPWDRGNSNPALIDALNLKPEWLGPSTKSDGSRKRALVPGCGRGYDLAVLAAHGYDAYGIEVSESAVKTDRKSTRLNSSHWE